jgi:GTP-binding protein
VRAQFLLSAASPADFPTSGLPEIALVGRSNVGKSTLINALVKKKVARTSAAPGKTRLANFYLIQSPIPNPKSPIPRLYLVDLPGYGYARGGHESVEAFEQLTQAYFDPSTREERRVAGVLQLIDSRHPDLPQDTAGYAWLLAAQTPIAIIATKIDKLNRSEQARTLRALKKNYDSPVLPVSAFDGEGLDEIWKTIRNWTEQRAHR